MLHYIIKHKNICNNDPNCFAQYNNNSISNTLLFNNKPKINSKEILNYKIASKYYSYYYSKIVIN